MRMLVTLKVDFKFSNLKNLFPWDCNSLTSITRTVHLTKKDQMTGYGFSVRGAAPVIIVTVEPGSLADLANVREGDYLVGLMDRDVKWWSHEQVVNMITDSMSYLRLTLVSPIKPWQKYKASFSETSSKDQSSVSSSASSASNIIRVFTPSSSSRTSFSSLSSTSSKDSDITNTTNDLNKHRKKSWAVLQIKNYKWEDTQHVPCWNFGGHVSRVIWNHV